MAHLSVLLSGSPAVTIDDDGPTYRLTEDGVGRPGMSHRIVYAPDSPYTHGSEKVSAAREQTSLPLRFKVFAASTAALEAACDVLEAALSQFTYTATVTEDGVSKIWNCDPASWSSGLVDSGEVAAKIRTYTVTIPVHPIPGA